MKRNLIIVFLTCLCASVFAQTKEEPKAKDDPMDISRQLEMIEKYGVPTIANVDEMKKKADALYEAKSWKEAVTAYEAYSKNVNWLANLLAQCVEPYYSASYDEKNRFSIFKIKSIVQFERKANECKANRNIAYVKMGLCYKNLGDTKNAVVYLHKGLDLLGIDETEYWALARNAMAEIIQFTPEK